MSDPNMHQPLPVAGYVAQPGDKVQAVNKNKYTEEKTLQLLDELKANPEVDQRWLAIGRTHIEQGWMAGNRAIFKPERAALKE